MTSILLNTCPKSYSCDLTSLSCSANRFVREMPSRIGKKLFFPDKWWNILLRSNGRKDHTWNECSECHSRSRESTIYYWRKRVTLDFVKARTQDRTCWTTQPTPTQHSLPQMVKNAGQLAQPREGPFTQCFEVRW